MTKEKGIQGSGPGMDTNQAARAIARDTNKPRGTPRGREASSQKGQLESTHRHASNKAIKLPIQDKTHDKEH